MAPRSHRWSLPHRSRPPSIFSDSLKLRKLCDCTWRNFDTTTSSLSLPPPHCVAPVVHRYIHNIVNRGKTKGQEDPRCSCSSLSCVSDYTFVIRMHAENLQARKKSRKENASLAALISPLTSDLLVKNCLCMPVMHRTPLPPQKWSFCVIELKKAHMQ